MLVEQCVEIYGNYAYDTEIIVASIRNPLHVFESALMGADIATVTFSVLKKRASHPMTDKGLQAFSLDVSGLPACGGAEGDQGLGEGASNHSNEPGIVYAKEKSNQTGI